MKQEIECNDWVYFELFQDIVRAYKVVQIFDDLSAEICANNGERLFKSISDMELITDAVKNTRIRN